MVEVHFYPHPHPIGQTVKKSISWNFLHFQLKCIFTPAPHPSNPHQPNRGKFFFNGFIHFMKFPAFLVEVHFLPLPPNTNPPPPPPSAKQRKKISMDLSISWNFLHFWLKCMLGSGTNLNGRRWKMNCWIIIFSIWIFNHSVIFSKS